MRKTIFLLGFAFIGMVAASSYYSSSLKTSDESDLLLANVEVLAQGESGFAADKVACSSTLQDMDSVISRINRVRCSDCLAHKCTDYSNSSECRK